MDNPMESMANEAAAVRERLIAVRCQYVGHVLDLLESNPRDEDERTQLLREYDFATAGLDILSALEKHLLVEG